MFTARYQGGIEEQGLFLKSTSSLVGAERRRQAALSRPPHRSRNGARRHHRQVRQQRSRRRDALDYVAGYCIALDMVVRGSEDRSFRKSIDTYSVAGPWMVTADEIPDPGHLNFSLARERRGAAGLEYRVHDHEHRSARSPGRRNGTRSIRATSS